MLRIIAFAGISLTLGLIGFSFSFARPTAGENTESVAFHVDIRVFSGGDPEPVAEHLVLFDGADVYSLPSQSGEPVTIIDDEADRVILLDRRAQIHTVIRSRELIDMTARLRTSAIGDAQKQRLGIAAEVQGDGAGNYSVAYGGIRYTTTTQKPTRTEHAVQFGKFAEWVSRLNIAVGRGMPPFGRMLMNSQIASDQRIPLETTLTFPQGDTTAHFRSTHDLVPGISYADRQTIDQVAQMLESSREVTFDKFHRREPKE